MDISYFHFPITRPTESDPVGGIKLENVKDLFGGEIVYYDKYGSNYSDIILKI